MALKNTALPMRFEGEMNLRCMRLILNALPQDHEVCITRHHWYITCRGKQVDVGCQLYYLEKALKGLAEW